MYPHLLTALLNILGGAWLAAKSETAGGERHAGISRRDG
jgi:hypothetical protein